MTRLKQRDMEMQVFLGVLGGFGDRTDRLADLEAEVPERIEDRLDQGLGRGGVPRHEHQQVDVAEGT